MLCSCSEEQIRQNIQSAITLKSTGSTIVEKEALALISFCLYQSSSPYSYSLIIIHYSTFHPQDQRLLRWSLALQEYNLVINHIKDENNVVADTLSQIETFAVLVCLFLIKVMIVVAGRFDFVCCSVCDNIITCETANALTKY